MEIVYEEPETIYVTPLPSNANEINLVGQRVTVLLTWYRLSSTRVVICHVHARGVSIEG